MKRVILFLASAGVASAAPTIELTAEQKQFFEQRIAPILSESCYKCHSHAEGKTKGGLALDTRDALLKGGNDGDAIVPGHPDKSMLLERVNSTDPDEKMPPEGPALTPEQIADLRKWIAMGAPDPRTGPAKGAIAAADTAAGRSHWAWQPLKMPVVPTAQNATWPKNEVDRFVLAKLEEKQMAPSELAERATLIRRAYYDLIGLPPMPWEVQAFIEDRSSNAWEKVIDRLLASPHYGERWGRYWLDVARYSDTKGDARRQENPNYVDAWTYRDYVIDSFNNDKPYNRFIMEQIAADKLDLGQDKRPLAALGFLTLGDRFNNNRNDIINDRIDVVTKGFLGLTVSCARCHDHMFDPIPQKDYYSLHGIFASTIEPKDNPIIAAQTDAALYQEYLKAREGALKDARDFAQETFSEIQNVFRNHVADFMMASITDGPARSKYLQKIPGRPREVEQMLRFFRRGGGPMIRRSPVFAPWFVLSELSPSEFKQRAPLIIERIERGRLGSRQPLNEAVVAMFRGKNPQTIEDVAGYYHELFTEVAKRIKAAEEKEKAKSGTQLPSIVSQTPKLSPLYTMATATKPSATGTSGAGSARLDEAYEELRHAPFQRDPIENFDPEEDGRLLPQQAQIRLVGLLQAVAKVDLTHPGAPKRAMAVEDAPRPVNSPVFIRGEANNRGEIVPRRFLEILAGPHRKEFSNGSGRLELAQAIASPANPLTPRVMVNRIWLHHFGEGIVTTPDDLGTQAAPPSHPELLDYLSMRFLQSGWSVKAMHKLIMLSATYQQKSDTNDKYAALDPGNRLLWRYNIRRLEFEPLRDTLLYISGKLDTNIGGQPVNILSEPYSDRRSVYGFIDRRNLPEMMNHFDFANPGMPSGKRHETTVPQQALFMMNSPLMVEVARLLLKRPEMKPASTEDQKIHALYWMIYQRPPRAEEVELGRAFLTAASAQSAELPDEPEPKFSDDREGRRFRKFAQMRRQQQLKMMEANRKRAQQNRRYGLVLENEGERVERRPLTAWEKYTHALLMANETVYYN